MTTITERLNDIEDDLNRILEMLETIITVEDASKHVKIIDTDVENILYRITSIEMKTAALLTKWRIAVKRSES